MRSRIKQQTSKPLEAARTLGEAIAMMRGNAHGSLSAFGRALDCSPGHVSDIEQGKRHMTLERAAEWLDRLGAPRELFVRLALQRYVDASGLRYRVRLDGSPG